MNVALSRPMTLPEFLAWEAQQDPRWKFDGSWRFAMACGGTVRTGIQQRLTVSLSTRVRRAFRRFYVGDLSVRRYVQSKQDRIAAVSTREGVNRSGRIVAVDTVSDTSGVGLQGPPAELNEGILRSAPFSPG